MSDLGLRATAVSDDASIPADPAPPASARRPARLPYWLLGGLFALLGWFTLTQGRIHGRTYDEYMQDDYGVAVLRWYLSRFQDRAFMEFPGYLHMPQHGSGFELVIAFFQHLTGEQWQTRTMVCGVFGLIGIGLMALCGRELAGRWGALAAATGLALYPRYTGAMFNNSKDVPLAVAMILVLWLVLRLMRRWSRPSRRFEVLELIALGAALGFAGSIRVNALVWVFLLALVVIGFWLTKGRRLRGRQLQAEIGRQFGAALIVGTVSYLVMALFWPYLLLYPVSGLLDSVSMMAAYDWNNPILFAGSEVLSTELPWYYAPVWLVVGSPLPMVVFGAVGLGWAGLRIARRRPVDGRMLLVAAYVIMPLLLIVVAHSTLYNSLRQFLFVVPGLVLAAAVVLVKLAAKAFANGRATLAWVLVGAAVLGQVEAVAASVRIYPYEYSYFSPIAGGFDNARHDFESTYYATCTSAAAVWLGEHWHDYTTEVPTFRDEHEWNSLAQADLPDNFIPIGNGDPIFRITTDPAGDGYTEIHTVMLEGEPLCRVSVQSTTS